MTQPQKHRFLYRRGSRLLLIWSVGLMVVVGYVVLMSAWQANAERWVSFSDALIPRSLDVLLCGWLFFVGSSIGSFLNVVAWRLPRGASVNGRSHCPWCNQTLSWKDNWPVFGWLALAGRCRTCRMPISPRYPIVELAVGLCILAVGMTELYGAGATLPFHPQRWGRTGALWTPHVTRDNLVLITYHVVAVAVGWAMGLVRLDGHRLPRSLVMISITILIAPLLAIPSLAVVPWQVSMDSQWRPDGRYFNAAMRVVTGVGAASLIGGIMSRCFSATRNRTPDSSGKGPDGSLDLIAMLMVPGIVAGWQATIAVTAMAMLIACALAMVLRGRDTLSRLGIALPIALTFQLCLWRLLHESTYWPSVGTAPVVMLGWTAMMLLIAYGQDGMQKVLQADKLHHGIGNRESGDNEDGYDSRPQ